MFLRAALNSPSFPDGILLAWLTNRVMLAKLYDEKFINRCPKVKVLSQL
jgi:hypothetical protein